MYPDQLVSGQLIQIYTVFKTSYAQVQHGMGHFTLFTGHHISLIFIFVNFLLMQIKFDKNTEEI